ncbi:hypothetical protein ACGFZB_36490 [Streptomyces cinerochromogenes]|uniref:PIN domain-containing protein n=1 Tax=Streptomyces cinerochromogenes TaxID=66422 RepID=A0ABW7BGE3_9ACTN
MPQLMARLGAAYSAVQDSVGAGARDEEYLAAPGRPAVVTAAARLAQVLVSNDQAALTNLHDAGFRWPLAPEPAGLETDEAAR